VLTSFLGAEPVYAESGKYAGTRLFEADEQLGLDVIRALPADQRATAILAGDGRFLANEERVQAGAQRDNIQLAYAGVRFGEADSAAQGALQRLIQVYTQDGSDRGTTS
jgi:hypothetical protein